MSGHNLARTLPPGDRDEAAVLPPDDHSASALQDMPADLFVGRDVVEREVQPGGAVEKQELLPGLTLIIDQCGPALDEAQMALGDLKLAQSQNNLALFKSSALRLADLTHHVARTAKNYRPSELQQE